MENKPIIVGLSGKKGSGKDSLAKKMVPYGWQRLSFAEELKDRVHKDFNLTVEQTDGALKETPCGFINEASTELTPRDIMRLCGQYYRSIDPMFWVKIVFKNLDTSISNKFIITDVRFTNEANFIRSKGGYMVRLERDPKLNIYKIQSNDISETQLDNYAFDYTIPFDRNINLDDLEREAKIVDAYFSL